MPGTSFAKECPLSSSHRRTRFVWAGVVLALLTLVFLRLYVLQVARAAGMAMAPTIVDQDRLVVDKLTYRFADPRAGDIVMMRYPLNPDRRFVMRVIAGENDRVELRAGRVYVNDQPIDDSYVASEARSHDNWGPHVVPRGHYFVLGDCRNNASDSRHWGFVPRPYITGRVASRWWPMTTARKF
jgi:signal peptidase I